MSGSSVVGRRPGELRRVTAAIFGRSGLQGSDTTWAVAFLVPYAFVFVLFVLYPVVYGLWLGHRPRLYKELFADPIYVNTAINTLIYVAFGTNLRVFLGLVLSGYFIQKGRWIKALMLVFVLPWAMPAIPSFISIHWLLNGSWGLLNNLLWSMFGIAGPYWLTSHWLTFGTAITAYVWKWMPFWTVILLAGRMAIPQDLYEAAEVDGAIGFKRFIHVTFPLARRTSIWCARCFPTIWTLGDFNYRLFHHRRRAGEVHPCAGDAGHPRRLRRRQPAAWHGGGDVGVAAADPAGDHTDAQVVQIARCEQ